ncbi:hypothetical protein [Streptomyces sp. SYSU K21746]
MKKRLGLAGLTAVAALLLAGMAQPEPAVAAPSTAVPAADTENRDTR